MSETDNWSTVPVRGLRHFHTRRDGYITGLSYRVKWHPDVNTAWCHIDTESAANTPDFVEWWDNVILTPPRPDHLMERCNCGFWVYFGEGARSFSGPVAGVVDGWGETIIGPEGFRCQKAKIVALAPSNTIRDWEVQYNLMTGYGGLPNMDQVRARYPDVPWFNSTAEMLAEFPPERGEYPVRPSQTPTSHFANASFSGWTVNVDSRIRLEVRPDGTSRVHVVSSCTCDECTDIRTNQ